MLSFEARAYSAWARFGLTAWIIVCLLLFSFIRFPYEVLKGRIEIKASQSLHRPVSLTRVRASLPLGLRFEGLRIGGVPVEGSFSVAPRLLPLFKGRLGLGFKAHLDQGRLGGFVTAPLGDKPGAPLVMGLEAEELDCLIFKAFVAPSTAELLSGQLSGRLDLSFEPGEIYKGEGRLKLNFKNGNLPLAAPELPIDSIGVKNLDLSARLNRGTLEVEQADLTGSLTGSLSGKIRLRRELGRSRLNLEGEMLLPAGMQNLLDSPTVGGRNHFSLSGTLDKPVLK